MLFRSPLSVLNIHIDATFIPSVDDGINTLLPTFVLDGTSSLMASYNFYHDATYYEQIGQRLSPMVIRGAQTPYIVL